MQILQSILLTLFFILSIANLTVMLCTLIEDHRRAKRLNDEFERVINRLAEDCEKLSENTLKQ